MAGGEDDGVGQLAEVAVETPLPAGERAHPIGEIGRFGEAGGGQRPFQPGAAFGVGAPQLGEELGPLARLGQRRLGLPAALVGLALAADDGGQLALHALQLGGLRRQALLQLGRPRPALFDGGGRLGDLGGVLLQLGAQPVAPVVALLQLDLPLVAAPLEPADRGGGGEQLGAQPLHPGRRLLQPGLGGGHRRLVAAHLGRGLVALGGQLGAAVVESGQRLGGGGDLLGPALRLAARLCRPLADLPPALAVGLEELLAPLDHGGEVGLALVAVGHLAGQVVEGLPPGRQRRFVAGEVGGQPGLVVGAGRQLLAQRRQPLGGERPAPGEHLAEQLPVLALLLPVAAGGAGLALERAEGALDLGDDVVEPQQVGPRLFELDLGDPAPRLVAGDAGRLFEQLAPLLRLAREDHADFPLLDHRVGANAQPGVHQQVLDLLEARQPAVDPVLALAGAEDPAAEQHAAVLGVRKARVGDQREVHLAHPQRLAQLRAGEDDVLHPPAAQALGALLAEHPGDGVGQVALAAAVGADDGGHAAAEGQPHRVDERLEPRDLETLQLHHGGAFLRTGGG